MRSHSRRIVLGFAIATMLIVVMAACHPATAPQAGIPATAAPAVSTGSERVSKTPEYKLALPIAASLQSPLEPPAGRALASPLAPPPGPTPTPDPFRSKTVIFDLDGGKVQTPDLWNPFVPGSRLDQGYQQAILEPLFVLDDTTGRVMPWLGEEMSADDRLDVWMLRLRQGVEWSDGAPFTADDVVFTVQMLLDYAPDLAYSAELKDWVARVDKVDDLTVRFTLTRPDPRFQLEYFAAKLGTGLNIVPAHIWAGQDPLTFTFYDPTKGWPVGTGPYRLESTAPTRFTYVRNDRWWGAKTGWMPLPQPEKLVWAWVDPADNPAALLAQHQMDSLADVTPDVFSVLRQGSPSAGAWSNDPPYGPLDPCVRTLQINATLPPWDDPGMRWALDFAIDRAELVQAAYQGAALPARHFLPAFPPLNHYVKLAEDAWLYTRYPVSTFDPGRAQQIIESRGWRKGEEGFYAKEDRQLSLAITTSRDYADTQRLAEVLVKQLQAVGINATERGQPAGAWDDDRSFGRAEAQVGRQMCGAVSEPWASMDRLNARWLQPTGVRAGANGFRWNNLAYSALVDQIGALPLGDPRIDDLFVQATGIYLQELPVIPLVEPARLAPFDTTYWTNWPASDNSYADVATWSQDAHLLIHNLRPAGSVPGD